jgi:bifunctional DNA-binding transcriptional regulator/antitoxin component of YhaV-PrlF toxin-antitoxin module
MRINSRGQVTIPEDIRRRARLLPYTEVDFIYDGKTVRIVRVDRKQMSRGARIVEHMRGRLSKRGLTTDQIMAMTRGLK